ncbi:MAG TPA: FkbM family methyltransferase [Solirubrobacteraceae bacterium]|nr:FkbM family methyltransferase [Solirubrobacteraceae bacterium]
MRSSLRHQFERSRFYFPIRTTIDDVLRPSRASRRKTRLDFLGQLVTRGMLVFDIGANTGEYAELYQALGCRVVAVEPFPACAEMIRRRLPHVTIVEAAVGAEPATATMHLGPDHVTNTLSERWAAEVSGGHPTELPTITVPITTVDALIAQHGTPDYVKIDVEGFERQVLAGLTDQPSLVSFEIHGSLIDEADACMQALPECDFSLTIGEDFAWTAEHLDRREMLRLIAELAASDPQLYGDVYARAG